MKKGLLWTIAMSLAVGVALRLAFPNVSELRFPAGRALNSERLPAPQRAVPALPPQIAKMVADPQALARSINVQALLAAHYRRPGLRSGKLRLDLARAVQAGKAFRTANPTLNPALADAEQIDLKQIQLPSGTAISYQIDAKCVTLGNSSVMRPDQLGAEGQELASLGAPIFVSRTIDTQESAQDLSDRADRDPCIRSVALGMAGSADSSSLSSVRSPAATGNERSQSSSSATNSEPDPDQKRSADTAISRTLVAGRSPVMTVVASPDQLNRLDPQLALSGESSGVLPVAATDGQTYVQLKRRALPIEDGSDVAISNAIVRAASSGATVINVYAPGFEVGNVASAVDYARGRGAVVVSHVGIPRPVGGK